jgi:6-pyruvoyltetrahydropterin/6-carboxytetrahydropterin synthase
VYRIRKKFTFEAAHQLTTAYTAPCHECVHGHSYTVEMILSSEMLDGMNMVLDFGYLKRFKNTVMERWDHGLLLHESVRDAWMPLIEAGLLKESKVHFVRQNPTAEFMARELFRDLRLYLDKVLSDMEEVNVDAVRVHETSTGWAEFVSEC